MIAFIDDHRGAYGVEPICKLLPIAHRLTMPMSPGGLIRRSARHVLSVTRPYAPRLRGC